MCSQGSAWRSSQRFTPIDRIIGENSAFHMPLMCSIPLIELPFVLHQLEAENNCVCKSTVSSVSPLYFLSWPAATVELFPIVSVSIVLDLADRFRWRFDFRELSFLVRSSRLELCLPFVLSASNASAY